MKEWLKYKNTSLIADVIQRTVKINKEVFSLYEDW